MNQEMQEERQGSPAGAGRRKGQKKASPQLMRSVRIGILVSGGLVLVIGLILLILPMFRVGSVEVNGCSYTTAEEIITASGIKNGDELFAVDMQKVVGQVLEQCPYVDKVSVSVSFPSKVIITVEERKNVMYTEFDGAFYSLDAGYYVLEESQGETAFSPFLHITLPSIASCTVGSRIRFSDPDADLSYIATLLEELRGTDLPGELTRVDVSGRFSVFLILDAKYRVKLGRVTEIPLKLQLCGEILKKEAGKGDAYAEIDLSDPDAATYRSLSEADF